MKLWISVFFFGLCFCGPQAFGKTKLVEIYCAYAQMPPVPVGEIEIALTERNLPALAQKRMIEPCVSQEQAAFEEGEFLLGGLELLNSLIEGFEPSEKPASLPISEMTELPELDVQFVVRTAATSKQFELQNFNERKHEYLHLWQSFLRKRKERTPR